MVHKKLLFFLVVFFTVSNSFSQQKTLTHILSKWEKDLMNNSTRSFTETAPPTGSVRNIAEWEPMESVLVAYTGSFGIPLSLIAEMSLDCNITTIVANASEETTVNNIYTSNSVNTANCTYVYQNPDSYWTRDYSPWYIAIDDNEVAIINFPYNRPRPNDNDAPILMANALSVDLYGMDVTHTGGNYMCDGYGMAASTDLVWDDNASQTHVEVNTKMQDYLGIDTYHVTLDPLDDYIKHIDCWGKFLDVDKVLITEVPASDYRYADYESVANYFASQNCSWGYPYEVIRVQAADASEGDVNPYTNSLILNNKVFVPQTGSALDAAALTVYENAMPGYEIFGVLSGSWINSDALHCRTHGIADREMLFIKHFPIHGDLTFQTEYTIEADVVSYGGSALSAGFPKLHYKQNESDWEEVVMTNTTENTYEASIPGINGNIDVSYYITAQNENSKVASSPQMEATDPFIFSYSGGSVGIQESSIKLFNIYPNPAKGSFAVKTKVNTGMLSIYDISGQVLFTTEIHQKNTIIDLENLIAGIYFVKISTGQKVAIQKLLME
jgi:agmatine/peptidylarginine deiminase